MADIEAGLKRPVVLDQLELIRLRNNSPAFEGEMEITGIGPSTLHITWRHPKATATLKADLGSHDFTVSHGNGADDEILMSFIS